MARNGSGTFVRLFNWVTDLGNSVPVTASRMDSEQDGFATALSESIARDGQTTLTANIPFATFKITGLGNGSARTDSIALGQVQDNTYEYLGENGGAADAYTFTPSPSIIAYVEGQSWTIKIGAGDGNTGASTFDISAVASRDIKKSDGAGSTVDLESGDLVAGSLYQIIDNGTEGVLQNPEKPHIDWTNIKVQATTSVTGVLFLPKQVTISNGTDTDHDIDFTAGTFQFDDGTGQAVVSALTKQIDAVWVAGDGVGGLDTGTVAIDSTYHLFAIHNPTTDVSDFLFSTSVSSPTMPSGYTKKKRIASLLTEGSANIRNGVYVFDGSSSYEFVPAVNVLDQDGSPDLTFTDLVLTVPTGITVKANLSCLLDEPGGTTIKMIIKDKLGGSDIVVATANGSSTVQNSSPSIFTDTTGKIQIRESASNADIYQISVYSYNVYNN